MSLIDYVTKSFLRILSIIYFTMESLIYLPNKLNTINTHIKLDDLFYNNGHQRLLITNLFLM